MRKKIFEILDERWFYLRWVVLDDFPYWVRCKMKDSVIPLMWAGVIAVAGIIIPYFNLKDFLGRKKKKGG